MPKTRTSKRSADNSSVRSETRHSRKPSSRLPVGEKKSGLTPAICFCEDIIKNDDDEEEATLATIKVKIDPNGADDRTNLEDKKFPQIKNLTYAGAEVMKSIRV